MKTRTQERLSLLQLQTTSRRTFFGRALRNGAAALGVFSFPLARAQVVDPCHDEPTDAQLLNNLLKLEHLSATLYLEALRTFNRNAFGFVDPAVEEDRQSRNFYSPNPRVNQRSRRNTAASSELLAGLRRLANHEQAHVETLQSLVQAAEGSPVSACRYRFDFTNARQFLRLALELKQLSVSAYAGAIATMCNPIVQTALATIATVEGRHAAWLSAQNGQSPFPSALDEPATGQSVAEVVERFTRNCPQAG